MNYRTDKQGNALSILGYGCMRFKRNAVGIDLDKAEAEVMAAYRAGVNYFDTAYIYPGSEAALGDILRRNGIREQVYIATKLPHYLVRRPEDIERIFREQLNRLGTDYIDFYLIHMLCDTAAWEKMKAFGIEAWIAEKKASGQIWQIGFSYHGGSDMFCRLVDAYPWEFCQIQYNYLDEHSQAGRRGLDYAHERGLPVVIMEPLRGGRLVKLPDDGRAVMEAHPVKYSPVQWALRWLWNQEKVTVVLSGMNSLEQVEDNVATASDVRVGELTVADHAMLARVVEAINARLKVGCTGCGYCVPCPRGVDIPGTFAAYNRYYNEGKLGAISDYTKCTAMRKHSAAASMCVGCGKCESHCPQGIAIRDELKHAARVLEILPYKALRKAVEWLKVF